jgi:predicted membrane-bound spermidine synthase
LSKLRIRDKRIAAREERPSRFLETLVVVSFLAIYFSSGFAALLYQVIWQRMLAIFSGADLYATTTIVASFMGGLGAGSLCAGFLADKVSARWQIGLFALAEFLTGVFGLLSKWFYYDILYSRFSHLASSPVVLTIVLFTSLLIPTFLMGMTLPLLSKALTPRVEMAGKRIGSIYALNTLGAAVGAFTTGWFLLGEWNFSQILQIGALINLVAGLLALLLGILLWQKLAGSVEGIRGTFRNSFRPTLPFPAWIVVYALSGFVALSLEIVWFRLLGVIIKSNSVTFSHVLGIYLASLALGILFGVQLVKWISRPAEVFLGLQSGITIYAGLSIAALVASLEDSSIFPRVRGYLAGYEPFDVGHVRKAIGNWVVGGGPVSSAPPMDAELLSVYLLVPLFMVGLPTFLMGLSFPFLQSAVQNDRDRLGRRTGWLQASNIFGATLGAILVGGVLLGLLGTTGTLRLLIVLGGTFPALLAGLLFPSRSGFRRLTYAAAVISIVLAAWSVPSRGDLWGRLHGTSSSKIISSEDGSGLSVFKNEAEDFSATTWVHSNGLGDSWIPYTQGDPIHSRLGALPALLHPQPVEIAVIGLASGNTLFGVGGREETREITCIEIVGPHLTNLRALQIRKPYGGLESLLSDVRVKYVFGDGRAYIGTNTRKYDIIEADALRPTSAFAGNLYSYEYFMLLRSHLKPGGMAVTWAPTQRVIQTFLTVFPHVFNFGGVMVGTMEPIVFDPAAFNTRIDRPFTVAYYAKAGINAKELLAPFLATNIESFRVDRRSFDLSDVNTDLFPREEYGR